MTRPARAYAAPRLLTAQEAADYFRLSVKAFERLKVGRVPFGAAIRYDRRALDAHLDEIAGLAPPLPAHSADNDPEAALDRFTANRAHASGPS